MARIVQLCDILCSQLPT